MFDVAIFGSSKVDGSTIEPGEWVISLSLFGSTELDFASSLPAPGVEVFIITLFGGARVKVRPEQEVRVSGFSLFGGRHVDPRRLGPPGGLGTSSSGSGDDEFDEPLRISAYSLFGGVNVKRQDGAK